MLLGVSGRFGGVGSRCSFGRLCVGVAEVLLIAQAASKSMFDLLHFDVVLSLCDCSAFWRVSTGLFCRWCGLGSFSRRLHRLPTGRGGGVGVWSRCRLLLCFVNRFARRFSSGR